MQIDDRTCREWVRAHLAPQFRKAALRTSVEGIASGLRGNLGLQ
jgi:hypothetical protein